MRLRLISFYALGSMATPVAGFLTEPNQASVASEKFWRMSSFDVISVNGIMGYKMLLCLLDTPLPFRPVNGFIVTTCLQ